jgi:hypothetical protein
MPSYGAPPTHKDSGVGCSFEGRTLDTGMLFVFVFVFVFVLVLEELGALALR